MVKSKTTKEVRAIDSLIKFQIDDGIESLTISGKDVLADVSIDRKSNVTLFLNADPDKVNEIQTLVPFINVAVKEKGKDPNKNKEVTLSQDLTQFALEIAENSQELATLIKSESSIVLDFNSLVQKLLEISSKLEELEDKDKEQDNRLTSIEDKDKEQDNRLTSIEYKDIEQDKRLTAIEIKTVVNKDISSISGYDYNNADNTMVAVAEYANETNVSCIKDNPYTHRLDNLRYEISKGDNKLINQPAKIGLQCRVIGYFDEYNELNITQSLDAYGVYLDVTISGYAYTPIYILCENTKTFINTDTTKPSDFKILDRLTVNETWSILKCQMVHDKKINLSKVGLEELTND